MEKLELKDIHFSYSENNIFKGYSHLFLAPKIYALIGDSGLGKSTLAAIMAGHLKADAGEILIDNEKVNLPSRDIFIVHQADDLFPWLTTIEQLNFVKKLTSSKIDIEQILKVFKLENYQHLYPDQLSGGMKKRLALIRAEIVNPKVLILDETFSSLDQPTLNSILEEMIPRWKNRSMIVLIITHQVETIASFVDEIIKL